MTFGFLNVFKPAGMTAHDVVARIRELVGIKQVGHGGTLDPLAEGVLPVALGKACRLLRFLPGTKVYLAEILLGRATTTDDIEGEVLWENDKIPGIEEIRRAIASFVGVSQQTPPLYSAIHHQGQRLYALARAGKSPVDIKARTVTIDQLSILEVILPVVQVRIACSAGTYIRAIARDLGKSLGCGGCLKSLLREQAGPFRLSDALRLEELAKMAAEKNLTAALISPAQALGLHCLNLDKAEARRLSMGQSLALDSEHCDDLLLVTCEGVFVALCRQTETAELKPEVVFTHGD